MPSKSEPSNIQFLEQDSGSLHNSGSQPWSVMQLLYPSLLRNQRQFMSMVAEVSAQFWIPTLVCHAIVVSVLVAQPAPVHVHGRGGLCTILDPNPGLSCNCCIRPCCATSASSC